MMAVPGADVLNFGIHLLKLPKETLLVLSVRLQFHDGADRLRPALQKVGHDQGWSLGIETQGF